MGGEGRGNSGTVNFFRLFTYIVRSHREREREENLGGVQWGKNSTAYKAFMTFLLGLLLFRTSWNSFFIVVIFARKATSWNLGTKLTGTRSVEYGGSGSPCGR